MPLTSHAHDSISRDWAERYDCDPAVFEESGVTLVDSGTDQTIRFLRRGDATVVAASQDVREALTGREAEIQRWPLVKANELLRHALDRPVGRVWRTHGPVVLSYVDGDSFTPAESSARLLETTDEDAFDALRERIPAEEWEQASPTFRAGRTAGLFRDDELVAVATLSEDSLPDVGVVVGGEARNEGLGQAVVSRVLVAAFQQASASVPRYRTPESVSASLSLAAALGFEQWATEMIVVREDA